MTSVSNFMNVSEEQEVNYIYSMLPHRSLVFQCMIRPSGNLLDLQAESSDI